MEETIAAISSAVGKAGIGIVRMSGRDSFKIGRKIFKSHRENYEIKNRYLSYGNIVDKGEIIDEVLIVFMRSPHTYTREDIVEIYCHGGIIAVKKILDLLLKSGARLAERGEFTKRAFLNGRLDLSQAEAVIDIINADTEKIHDQSLKHLEGAITKKVKEIKDILLNMLTQMEYSINFMEDAQEELPMEPVIKDGYVALDKIDKMLKTKNKGKIVKEGISTAIIGKPNVGKSSLLNNLLNENRAIVTDIPGTTRDTIEESIDLDGIKLKIVDTAGIRATEDFVESIGVEKSIELAKSSDLLIAIFDSSMSLEEEDLQILNLLKDRKSIIILNKIDKGKVLSYKNFKDFSKSKIIETSMKENVGVENLVEAISSMFFEGDITSDEEVLITSSRHADLLYRAKLSLESSLRDLENNMTLEACEIDLRNSYENLAEITGESVGEEVLDRIFNEFCVGK